MAGQTAHQPGDVGGVARAHEDVVDAGEDGSVAGRRERQVDLAQVVDADAAVVTLLGQPHLDEVGGDGELDQPGGRGEGEPWHRPVGRARRDPAGNEVGVEDPGGDLGRREGCECPADVTARVPVLEPAGADDVERRAGHDAELAGGGNGVGESPIRDRHSHAALDDHRVSEGLGGVGASVGGDGHGGSFSADATSERDKRPDR